MEGTVMVWRQAKFMPIKKYTEVSSLHLNATVLWYELLGDTTSAGVNPAGRGWCAVSGSE